jgi:O-antigen/teichoic acid export membrane protein
MLTENSVKNPYYWGTIDIVLEQLSQIVLFVFLSRNLNEEIFGLFAVLQTITFIALLIMDSGLGSGVISFQIKDRRKLNQIFTFNLLISFSIVLILVLFRGFILKWFNIAEFERVYLFTVVFLVIEAFSLIQYSQIKRDLRFRRMAFITLVSIIVTFSSIIPAVKMMSGEYVLLLRLVVPKTVRTIGYFISTRYRPSFDFSIKSLGVELRYGLGVMYMSILNWFNQSIMVFYIGGKAGTGTLGYYNRAYGLQKIASKTVSTVLNRIGFSVMSSVKGNDLEVLNNYINSRIFLMLGGIFLALPVQWFSEIVVTLVIGERWHLTAIFLKFLIPISLISQFYDLNVTVNKAYGKLKYAIWIDSGEKISFVLLLLIMNNRSIEEILFGLGAIRLLNLIISDFQVSRMLGYFPKKINFIVYILVFICFLQLIQMQV